MHALIHTHFTPCSDVLVACSKLETQVAILQGETISINQLLVHPCFPVVVSANDSDTIRCV